MSRITFENLPSENTPINADNLNKLNNVVISSEEPTTGEEVWIKKGKNLFKLSEMLGVYSSASIIDGTENSVVLKGAAATFQYLTLTKFLKAGTYAFQKKWSLVSGTANAQTGAVFITKDSDGSSLLDLSSSTKKGTFTINEDMTIKIVIYLSIGTALTEATQIEVYDIQLENNAEATEYEAYVDKEIYVKNDNDVYDLFDKVEKPQYFQAILTSSKTLSFDGTQYQSATIPFNKITAQNGDFSLNSGVVKIGKNISRIKVTINVMLNGVTTETVYSISVRTSSEAKAFAYLKIRANSSISNTWIIDVKEGEELYIAMQNQGTSTNSVTVYGASSSATTSLLMEKIA